MGSLGAWWVFCQERFPLGSHLVMIVCFTLANAAAGVSALDVEFDWTSYALSIVVAFSFFLRLRCFDEIKDYEVDIKHNPERPLARGLLSIPQVMRAIRLLVIVEVCITYYLGTLLSHMIAVVYSFAMYKEFFVGSLIRPHLTTYAVMHTLVSVFIGYSVASMSTGVEIQYFTGNILSFGLANWALFNLFEFARKTYALSEERPGVETYSFIFGSKGAASLSLSQIFAGIGIACFSGIPLKSIFTISPIGVHAAMAAPFVCATIFYGLKASPRAAFLFRKCISIYLLAFYILLTIQLGNFLC